MSINHAGVLKSKTYFDTKLRQFVRKTDNHSLNTALFQYHNDEARKVCIAGTFNNWQTDVLEMLPMGKGKWIREISLPPGSYEYLLIADGAWVLDPSSKKEVPNPFGGMNSVLEVL